MPYVISKIHAILRSGEIILLNFVVLIKQFKLTVRILICSGLANLDTMVLLSTTCRYTSGNPKKSSTLRASNSLRQLMSNMERVSSLKGLSELYAQINWTRLSIHCGQNLGELRFAGASILSISMTPRCTKLDLFPGMRQETLTLAPKDEYPALRMSRYQTSRESVANHLLTLLMTFGS